jgi:isopenicillin-N N-acyltransferase like protein
MISGADRAELPLLRVQGSHRDVGTQVGQSCAPAIRRAADLTNAGVPRDGRTIDELLRDARAYRRATEAAFPWIVEELDAVASGAGVDAEALFAASIEELWASRPSQCDVGGIGTIGRCTDVLFAPDATCNGHILVGHNNDLAASCEPDVVAIEWRVPNEPTIFTLGVGPWISVGWNSAGLSLTGNEVSPNDERPGIPRLLLMRAQVRARTLEEAIALATHRDRASSYNTVYAHREGGCVDVEASATASCCIAPNESGSIVHTNHYVADEMVPFEGDPAYAVRSRCRLERAQALVNSRSRLGVTMEDIHGILSDHDNGPDAICRHAREPGDTKTVFWCIADVTAGTVSYGKGNPCCSVSQDYAFS